MSAEAVKSAKRCLEILELLTRGESPLTFSQIGEALALPRSSLHGLLATLLDAGWLSYEGSQRTYWLGLRTLEAGNAYLRSQDLPNRAQPLMQGICEALDETVQLSVLDGRFNVYVGKVDGRQALALASAVGRRLPAHATGVGKVLLSGLDGAELDRLLDGVRLERYTERTIADKAALHRRLDRIRRDGYGTDDEEYTVGLRCVAVPVRDHTGRVVAAMSVSVPAFRFDQERSDVILGLLLGAAAGLSSELGYQPAAVAAAAARGNGHVEAN